MDMQSRNPQLDFTRCSSRYFQTRRVTVTTAHGVLWLVMEETSCIYGVNSVTGNNRQWVAYNLEVG